MRYLAPHSAVPRGLLLARQEHSSGHSGSALSEFVCDGEYDWVLTEDESSEAWKRTGLPRSGPKTENLASDGALSADLINSDQDQ